MPEPTNVTFFRTPAELRKWFQAHHATADELWVGFYSKGAKKPATRMARLEKLIGVSARGRRL